MRDCSGRIAELWRAAHKLLPNAKVLRGRRWRYARRNKAHDKGRLRPQVRGRQVPRIGRHAAPDVLRPACAIVVPSAKPAQL